jgi:hypothetical protein
MPRRIIVRVLFSHERAREAEQELTVLAGFGSYPQGTSPERIWDFGDLERAQMFKIQGDNTPGVARIELD